jgi:hypothetical protein
MKMKMEVEVRWKRKEEKGRHASLWEVQVDTASVRLRIP